MAAASAQLQEALNEFTATGHRPFAEDLLSVALFGRLQRGACGRSPMSNVVLVLGHFDPKKLKAIGESYRFAHAEIRLSAMFILENEIGIARMRSR